MRPRLFPNRVKPPDRKCCWWQQCGWTQRSFWCPMGGAKAKPGTRSLKVGYKTCHFDCMLHLIFCLWKQKNTQSMEFYGFRPTTHWSDSWNDWKASRHYVHAEMILTLGYFKFWFIHCSKMAMDYGRLVVWRLLSIRDKAFISTVYLGIMCYISCWMPVA